MENAVLVVSLILNGLLIVTTSFLIWDKLKPEKIRLKCRFKKDSMNPSKYFLVLSNPTRKILKIKRIRLNDEDISIYELKNSTSKFPIILHPEHEIPIPLYISLTRGKPSNCKVEISKCIKNKILEFSI